MSQRTVAGLVAAFLALLGVAVLLVPIVFGGELPSPLEVLVAAGEVLLLGFVLRTRRSPPVHSLGFWLLIVGLLGVGFGLAGTWLAASG